jgi:hypothetical protein
MRNENESFGGGRREEREERKGEKLHCWLVECTNPVTTTKKSIMFQIFLRYEFLCITKPKARIFRDASTQKMARKYTSVLSLKRDEKKS